MQVLRPQPRPEEPEPLGVEPNLPADPDAAQAEKPLTPCLLHGVTPLPVMQRLRPLGCSEYRNITCCISNQGGGWLFVYTL